MSKITLQELERLLAYNDLPHKFDRNKIDLVFASTSYLTQDSFKPVIEDEDRQWTYHQTFVETTAPRLWRNHLHYKLFYLSPEALALMLLSPLKFERDHALSIKNNNKIIY